MSRSIYQIAKECKSFSDKYIKYFQQIVASRTLCFVVGANKSFEGLLLSLCDAMTEKYPYVATKIKEHTLQYDRMPVIHQSAIDELLNYVINLEKPTKSNKKFFISHSTEDEIIINGFIEKILMLGCGFKRPDIFCTLDHTVIRTGDDFRNEIIKNMKGCDYIMCMISDNYRNSEVCQNEMGAAWAMEKKRVLPFKFPNLKFTEIGFLNVVKQAADITDKSKLDELYEELCKCYDLEPDWRNYNKQKDDFVELICNHI